MKQVKIEHGQTQVDIAIQELGDIERLFEIALLNDKRITDDLPAGSFIQVPDYDLRKRDIVNVFKLPVNKPASGVALINGEPQPEGIEYWGIEMDFVIS